MAMTNIIVRSSNALAGALPALAPAFERAQNCTLSLCFDTAAAHKDAINAGATVDVAILTAPAIADLAAAERIDRASVVAIARTGIAIAVRAGAAVPDIASAAALVRSLRAASSVAFTTHGASGIYFVQLLRRLGIADEINAKAKTRRGGLIAELVASGEAALAVQQMSELVAVAGVTIAGPLPPSLQSYTDFAAGAAPGANAVARAFVALLVTAETRALFAAKGLQPPATPRS